MMSGKVAIISTAESGDSVSLVPKLDYSRWAQGVEIGIAFLAIQATLWSTGTVRLCFHLFAAFWIVSTTLLHRKKIASLGFNTGASTLKRSAWIIWVSLALSLVFAVIAY